MSVQVEKSVRLTDDGDDTWLVVTTRAAIDVENDIAHDGPPKTHSVSAKGSDPLLYVSLSDLRQWAEEILVAFPADPPAPPRGTYEPPL